MREKERTLCDILAEMRKTVKYNRRHPDDDFRHTLDRIQDLIKEAQEAGKRLESALEERTRILSGRNFVKCTKCGWEEVDVELSACAGCGLPVKRTGERNPRWELAYSGFVMVKPIEGSDNP